MGYASQSIGTCICATFSRFRSPTLFFGAFILPAVLLLVIAALLDTSTPFSTSTTSFMPIYTNDALPAEHRLLPSSALCYTAAGAPRWPHCIALITDEITGDVTEAVKSVAKELIKTDDLDEQLVVFQTMDSARRRCLDYIDRENEVCETNCIAPSSVGYFIRLQTADLTEIEHALESYISDPAQKQMLVAALATKVPPNYTVMVNSAADVHTLTSSTADNAGVTAIDTVFTHATVPAPAAPAPAATAAVLGGEVHRLVSAALAGVQFISPDDLKDISLPAWMPPASDLIPQLAPLSLPELELSVGQTAFTVSSGLSQATASPSVASVVLLVSALPAIVSIQHVIHHSSGINPLLMANGLHHAGYYVSTMCMTLLATAVLAGAAALTQTYSSCLDPFFGTHIETTGGVWAVIQSIYIVILQGTLASTVAGTAGAGATAAAAAPLAGYLFSLVLQMSNTLAGAGWLALFAPHAILTVLPDRFRAIAELTGKTTISMTDVLASTFPSNLLGTSPSTSFVANLRPLILWSIIGALIQSVLLYPALGSRPHERQAPVRLSRALVPLPYKRRGGRGRTPARFTHVTVTHARPRNGDRNPARRVPVWRFRRFAAVKDVSLVIRRGEVTTITGAANSGKTTLLHAMLGTVATTGDVSVLGVSAGREHRLHAEILPSIGYVPQNTVLSDATVAAHLDTLARVRRVRGGAAGRAKEANRVLTLVGLQDVARTRATNLLPAQQRLLAVAMAVVGRPTLVLMDEPCTGMGAEELAAFNRTLRAVAKDASVVLAERAFNDHDSLVDSVAVLKDGVLITKGSVQRLKHYVGHRHRLDAVFANEQLAQSAQQLLQSVLGDVEVLVVAGCTASALVPCTDAGAVARAEQALAQVDGLVDHRFTMQTLEDVIHAASSDQVSFTDLPPMETRVQSPENSSCNDHNNSSSAEDSDPDSDDSTTRQPTEEIYFNFTDEPFKRSTEPRGPASGALPLLALKSLRGAWQHRSLRLANLAAYAVLLAGTVAVMALVPHWDDMAGDGTTIAVNNTSGLVASKNMLALFKDVELAFCMTGSNVIFAPNAHEADDGDVSCTITDDDVTQIKDLMKRIQPTRAKLTEVEYSTIASLRSRYAKTTTTGTTLTADTPLLLEWRSTSRVVAYLPPSYYTATSSHTKYPMVMGEQLHAVMESARVGNTLIRIPLVSDNTISYLEMINSVTLHPLGNLPPSRVLSATSPAPLLSPAFTPIMFNGIFAGTVFAGFAAIVAYPQAMGAARERIHGHSLLLALAGDVKSNLVSWRIAVTLPAAFVSAVLMLAVITVCMQSPALAIDDVHGVLAARYATIAVVAQVATVVFWANATTLTTYRYRRTAQTLVMLPVALVYVLLTMIGGVGWAAWAASRTSAHEMETSWRTLEYVIGCLPGVQPIVAVARAVYLGYFAETVFSTSLTPLGITTAVQCAYTIVIILLGLLRDRREAMPKLSAKPASTSDTTDSVLELAHVTHTQRTRRGRQPVLRDVSFTACAGEGVAVCGPPGCGKSTLIRAALGRLSQISGTITCNGEVSWVPSKVTLFNTLTVSESLRLFAHLTSRSYAYAYQCAVACGAGHLTNMRPCQLSYTDQRRVQLALAMITGTELMLVDDLDLAIDPRAYTELAELCRQLRAQGTCIVVASRSAQAAAAVASHALVMGPGGSVSAVGTVEDVCNLHAPGLSVTLEVVGEPSYIQSIAWLATKIGVSADQITYVATVHDNIYLTVNSATTPAKLNAELASNRPIWLSRAVAGHAGLDAAVAVIGQKLEAPRKSSRRSRQPEQQQQQPAVPVEMPSAPSLEAAMLPVVEEQTI